MDEKALPGETQAEWEEVRDGEVWRYRVSASPHLPDWLGFPGVRQVVRMERWVWEKRSKKVRYSVVYALTSLGPEEAGAERLGMLLRERWDVENGSFWVRDVLLREDDAQAGGVLRFNLSVLRGFLVSWLNHQGVRAKKAALEVFSFNPPRALRFLGLDTANV
ncbi:MAG: DDE transposase family protein [Chloracidobacterium sp.]|nr:DDE transposase family protein [Chloracidobacterium sp.]